MRDGNRRTDYGVKFLREPKSSGMGWVGWNGEAGDGVGKGDWLGRVEGAGDGLPRRCGGAAMGHLHHPPCPPPSELINKVKTLPSVSSGMRSVKIDIRRKSIFRQIVQAFCVFYSRKYFC